MLLSAHPILISGHGFTVYTHGFFFALGAVVATLQACWLLKGVLRPVEVVERCFWIFVISLFAARLGFLLIYPDEWTSVSQIVTVWQGGLVSYVGMLSGVGMTLLFWRRLPEEKRTLWLNTIVLVTLVGWAIGRLGNYFAADSYGVLSPVWSAFYGRVPIQLFESLLCLGLAALLWWKRPQPLLLWGLFGYNLGRFVIDFWRDEGSFLGLHVSQWVSLVLVLLSSLLLVRYKRTHD